jgi:hypothetical protein
MIVKMFREVAGPPYIGYKDFGYFSGGAHAQCATLAPPDSGAWYDWPGCITKAGTARVLWRCRLFEHHSQPCRTGVSRRTLQHNSHLAPIDRVASGVDMFQLQLWHSAYDRMTSLILGVLAWVLVFWKIYQWDMVLSLLKARLHRHIASQRQATSGYSYAALTFQL